MLAVSDTVWLAVISTLGGIMTAALTLIATWLNRVKSDVAKVKEGQQYTDANVAKIEKATNSIVSQLVETTRKEAHAAGMKDEKDRPA
jgi:hypothetical protein